jgi:hypothetical protein
MVGDDKIPLPGARVSLAQCNVLYLVRVAEILRERKEDNLPRVRLSKKTSDFYLPGGDHSEVIYSWHLTVNSLSARTLERMGLIEIKLLHCYGDTYDHFAYLSDKGRKALANRDKTMQHYATQIEQNDARE